MARAMGAGQRGRGGRAGGKEGKRALGPKVRASIAAAVAETDASRSAQGFLEVAAIADERGMPQVAAYLALRACERQIDASNVADAVAAGTSAVGFAEGMAETKRVGRFFTRTLKKLRSLDADAAEELDETARKQLGLKKLPTPGERLSPNRAQRRALPKSCPACGIAVDGKSLEFENDGTADCPQCGAALA